MCGFIGCATFRGDRPPPMPEMSVNRVRWRGPDVYGEEVGDDYRLSCARLAIIDPGAEANQPLSTEDCAWKLVFNGEIYNYRELAAEHNLSKRARRSDSWALLELIAKLGVKDACQSLRGMYALAAWQVEGPRLWLARDPFGIKPLAWTRTKQAVLFGSDARSLAVWRNALNEPINVDPYALTHYLMVGYVPGDATAWDAIERVSPGSVVAIDERGSAIHHWDPLSQLAPAPAATADEVDTALRATVARHLVADVEVGAFLSGGIDSSLIVALAHGCTASPIRTYSVGFDSTEVADESTQAEHISRILGGNHASLRVGSTDFRELAEAVATAFPEPFADAAAMPTLALARRASEEVKVVLTGEGGDEMFGGYRRYWALPLARHRWAQAASRMGLSGVAASLGGRRARQMIDSSAAPSGEAYLRYLTQLSWDEVLPASGLTTPSAIARSIARYQWPAADQPTVGTLRRLELGHHLPECYLPKADRTTMRHGLEARVPFLDLDLAAVAFRLKESLLTSRGQTKVLLRRVASRYLPVSITRAPKRGFSVPLSSWMSAGETPRWVRETLFGGEAVEIGLLDQAGLPRVLARLDNFSREETAEAGYRLLELEFWCRSARADGAL